MSSEKVQVFAESVRVVGVNELLMDRAPKYGVKLDENLSLR